MTRLADLHRAWSKEPEYRAEYERLGPEFALARSLIEAQKRARLTQAELAERMATTRSVVARLERGRVCPLTRTLENVARAIGTRLRIELDPTRGNWGKHRAVGGRSDFARERWRRRHIAALLNGWKVSELHGTK